jgi:hypothetical protein
MLEGRGEYPKKEPEVSSGLRVLFEPHGATSGYVVISDKTWLFR